MIIKFYRFPYGSFSFANLVLANPTYLLNITQMTGFDIVMIIAIILFARLGIRLVSRYIKMKQENEKEK